MIKKLSAYIKQYKKFAIATPICVVAEVILEIIIPLLMANLIDFGIEKGNMNYIVKIGAVLLVCALMSLVAGALAGKFVAKASAGFAANLRYGMYSKVQEFSFSNIDKFSTAGIITRLTTDVTNVQNAFMMILRMAIRSPFMLVFAFFATFKLSSKISLIFLFCLPVLAIGLSLIISHAFPIFTRTFKKYDKLGNVVEENLHGMRVVKAFTREDFEIQKFKTVSGEIFKDFSAAEKLVSFSMPLMQLSMYTAMILISWISAKLIVASGNNPELGLTTGSLTSVFSYAVMILISLMLLSFIVVQITLAKASAKRICEILDEKCDITDPENAITDVRDGSIEFKNVSFVYSNNANKPVLDNINLSIKSGETIGIIGGTGSAKSSLVQLIPRLYDVKSGSVSVGGTDVRKYSVEALRNAVAMVLQKNVLFSGTINDNIRWGNKNATDEEIVNVCKLACADEFISSFPDKYNTYIEQGGTNVSGGQKQRLCIARALLKNAKILILDDSTSAVDTKTDSLIQNSFKTELPDTTKIIIAQRISSVRDADRIIVMDDGKIDSIGTHEELLQKSTIYREVFNSQNRESDINA